MSDECKSFVALYHWCGRNSADTTNTTEFHQAFTGHLLRLGASQESQLFKVTTPGALSAEQIEWNALRRRAGFAVPEIVEQPAVQMIGDAKRVCLTLAVEHKEIPAKWCESPDGFPPSLIPLNPIRTLGHIRNWIESHIEDLPMPGSVDYDRPSTLVRLCDVLRQSVEWLNENGHVAPAYPPVFAATVRWARSVKRGAVPAVSEMRAAIDQLLESMQIPESKSEQIEPSPDEINLSPSNSPSVGVDRTAGSPKATVNARMIDMLRRRPESRNWTISQWAESLGCGRSTIHGTAAWGELQKTREAAGRELFVKQTAKDRKGKRQHRMD